MVRCGSIIESLGEKVVGPSGSFPSVLFLIQRRWMADSDGAGPDDDEYDKLDYIPSVSVRISSHFRQFTRMWPNPKYSYFTEKEKQSFFIKRF